MKPWCSIQSWKMQLFFQQISCLIYLPFFMLNKQGKSSVLQTASSLSDHFPQSITAPGTVEGWRRVFSSPMTSYRGYHVVLKTASWLIINL